MSAINATPSSLKHTPLHAQHLAASAKMVDFGGWHMPLHYGSQVDEHHVVRRAVGVFDVSHMRSVDVTGPGARDFLRQLLANDVIKLNVPGKALYSCMLNPAGGVIDDLIVYFLGGERWRVVVNAACADQDIAWMQTILAEGTWEAILQPRADLAMLAIQGPQARDALARSRPAWEAVLDRSPFTAALLSENALPGESNHEVIVACTGYTGEDGYEVILPAVQAQQLWDDLLAQGVKPCGLGARDTLRLEAGMNLYGQDMDAQTSLLEAGLGWTLDRRDSARQFIGRAALDAATPQSTFLGVVLLGRGVLRSHMALRCAQGSGELTSGTFSPTLNRAIGMGRLPVGAQAGDTAEVDIRGQWMPARIVKLPFVRKGRVLVEAVA